MHCQFEVIHQFVDGNGRTGRGLNLLYVVDKRLLDMPVIYLSWHIIRHKARRCNALIAVMTEEAWEPWILFMPESVRVAAEWTTGKIIAIRELLDQTATSIRRSLPKICSRKLVELAFIHPHCRISDVDAGVAKRQIAAVYLKAIASEESLKQQKPDVETPCVNRRLLTLLSDQAQTGMFRK